MRFVRALSLLLVFCLTSTFTLACAFACQDPTAPAVSSHCHQVQLETKADPAPLGTPYIENTSTECPMLSEMDRRPASLSASSVAKVSVQPHALLPLETAVLLAAKAPVTLAARAASLSPLPLYLKKRVLRL